LKRIESHALPALIRAVVIPSTVLFVAGDAHEHPLSLSLSDPDSCPEFDSWRRLEKSRIKVDFRRILTSRSGFRHFERPVLDLSAFEEGSVIRRSDHVSTRIYRRRLDGALAVVKAISLSGQIPRCNIETEIENLLNLRHPAIAPLIGFHVESGRRLEFKTARLHAAEPSLADVLSSPPAWWTPTAKAKAVVGIALALRFAHGLGLLHGAVKAENVFFDADRRVQIADFSPIRLKTGAVEPFSGEEWTPAGDICGFATLLSEIAVDRSQPAAVPPSVSQIITEARSPRYYPLSFRFIVRLLTRARFEIVAGLDSEEVSAFVKSIESAELGRESE
jgi:serine/threonine protein kinase